MDSTTVFSEVDEHGYLNGRKNPFWWPTEFGIKAEIETSIGSSGVHALFVRGKENLPVDTLYKLIPADSYKATMWEVKEATVAGLASPITTTERNCDTLVVKPRSLIERELAHYAIYTYTPTWTPPHWAQFTFVTAKVHAERLYHAGTDWPASLSTEEFALYICRGCAAVYLDRESGQQPCPLAPGGCKLLRIPAAHDFVRPAL
jgi:hypothetical protein